MTAGVLAEVRRGHFVKPDAVAGQNGTKDTKLFMRLSIAIE